jgi:hypothetical protein
MGVPLYLLILQKLRTFSLHIYTYDIWRWSTDRIKIAINEQRQCNFLAITYSCSDERNISRERYHHQFQRLSHQARSVSRTAQLQMFPVNADSDSGSWGDKGFCWILICSNHAWAGICFTSCVYASFYDLPIKMLCLVNKFIKHSPSWDADSCSSIQKSFNLLWTGRFNTVCVEACH